MKKKFDFSAEMSEVESIKTTPKNEYLEEEKRLLDVNAKELASLNDNVYKLRIEVEICPALYESANLSFLKNAKVGN